MNAMSDLFGVPPLPGLKSRSHFGSPVEELALIGRIHQTGLLPFTVQRWLGKRLTTSYGLDYNFDEGRLAVAEPISNWLGCVRKRAARFAGLDPDICAGLC